MADFSVDGVNRGNTPLDVFWWDGSTKDKGKILSALNNDFDQMAQAGMRLAAYERYASLYTNERPAHQMRESTQSAKQFEGLWEMMAGKYTRIPYNLMKQVIDEVVSRIIKSHPKATFITTAGDEDATQRAKMMERWNQHLVYRLHQTERFDQVIKDACLHGLGALKITKAYREDRVEARVCYPGNLFVDPQETLLDQPTRLHHRRFVARSALLQLFPKFQSELRAAGKITTHDAELATYGQYSTSFQDLVEIVESWHLPTYDGAGDGQHYLWVNKTILQHEAYERRHFPFAFFQWKKNPRNTFYGTGLAEDLIGVHVDANITLRRVNTAIEAGAVPTTFYKRGSVNPKDLTNAPGAVVPYDGDIPPQTVVPVTVPSDLLNYVREHEARAYKIAGLSSGQSEGNRIPSGLETGRAVQNYFSVESVPFATQLRKFEYFVQDVANANVAAGREVAARNKKWSVVVPGDRHTIEQVPWKDIALDPREDSFVIKATPTSVFSESFAAKLDEVQRTAGLVPSYMTEEKITEFLGLPDTDRMRDYITEAQNNGEAMISHMLKTGQFVSPTPFMNLEQFIADGDAAINRAERMNTQAGRAVVPELHISELRRAVRRAREMHGRRKQAALMEQQGQTTPAAMPTDSSGTSPNAVPQPFATR